MQFKNYFGIQRSYSYTIHLCFSQCLNRHWLVPHFWSSTRKARKITVFKRSVDKIQINLCLVMNFRCCVMVLTFWNFPKLPKTRKCWTCFSVLWNNNHNHFDSGWQWLTTAAHNHKWLMKTKISHIHGIVDLVPYDSWYSDLGLSFGIRSKALTV